MISKLVLAFMMMIGVVSGEPKLTAITPTEGATVSPNERRMITAWVGGECAASIKQFTLTAPDGKDTTSLYPAFGSTKKTALRLGWYVPKEYKDGSYSFKARLVSWKQNHDGTYPFVEKLVTFNLKNN